jgi:P27 family predicted phage terminase small subunit
MTRKPAFQADHRPITVIPPPPGVSGDAAEIWAAIITAMAGQRTLSAEALPAIERYCILCIRWRTAEQHLGAEGEVTAAKRTGVPQVNPWLGISRATAAQLARLEKDLGLTPAHRAIAARRPLRIDGTAAPLNRMERMASGVDEDA